VRSLPPYLFVEIDRAKSERIKKGADLIDFGIGDPDQPTPEFIIRAFRRALRDPKTHRYPSDHGHPAFRQAIATWYADRFGVALNADREILPLIGSKEGITHMPLAFINPGDRVIVPEPGYPGYRSGVLLAGGKPVSLPLHAENNFLVDWDEAKKKIYSGSKMISNIARIAVFATGFVLIRSILPKGICLPNATIARSVLINAR